MKAALDNGRLVLRLPQRFYIGNADELKEVLQAFLARGYKDVVADFSRTDYVDSAGLAEIVRSYTVCSRAGGSFVLNRVNGRVTDLLSITKLLTVFQILDVDYSLLAVVEVSPASLDALLNPTEAQKDREVERFLLRLADGKVQVLPTLEGPIYRVTFARSDDLLIASPLIIANRTLSFLRHEIEEFEGLLNSPLAAEGDFQRFFEKYPKFLVGRDYKELLPHVVLERSDTGPLIPDFLLRPHNEDLCDITEIKLPSASLLVGGANRRRFSAAISEAAAQLRTYRDYFDDEARRESVRAKYGVTAFRPKMVVIAGRQADVDPITYRQIKQSMSEIEVVTYDELLRKSKQAMLL